METLRDVIVTVDDSHVDKTNEIAARLSIVDFKIKSILCELGIITGKLCHTRIDETMAIDGIKAVEFENVHHIQEPIIENPFEHIHPLD